MNSPEIGLLSLTALACAVAAQAQTTTGGVRRREVPQGRRRGRRLLVIRNLETGFTRTQMTDSKGSYSFSLLPVGRYELTVTAQGLKTIKDGSVRVTLGGRACRTSPSTARKPPPWWRWSPTAPPWTPPRSTRRPPFPRSWWKPFP